MFTHANCSTDFAINLTKCGLGDRHETRESDQSRRQNTIYIYICYKYYVLDYLLLTMEPKQTLAVRLVESASKVEQLHQLWRGTVSSAS